MYQFFVEPSQIQDKKVIITGSDVNHMKNVLRMKTGEEIAVKNGVDGKEYRCGIEEFAQDQVICSLRFIREEGVELPSKIYLFQGIPKADKMELIVQKGVELGVFEVIPVAVKRCVVKLDEKKAQAKVNRWQGIAQAAAKQCKRGIVPVVKEPMTMKEAVTYARGMDVKLIPYELAEDMAHTKKIIEAIRPGESVAVFIGPEGGFEESEVAEALAAGIEPVTLGKRILRTETAGLAVLSLSLVHI
ncbi:MAG: 16S rRNA (uracil(1498)-N(3))-methyltransferase, partial [Lachnospiraceae bacterium]|nr:16S rRNA (uracil(1498)-N(3))-methyltransferase [Lachnospiraceae bacterium]